MSAPLLEGTLIDAAFQGMLGFSPGTPAGLWRNGGKAASFHHKLIHVLTKPAGLRRIEAFARRQDGGKACIGEDQNSPPGGVPACRFFDRGAPAMPTETVIAIAVIVTLFAIYAGSLAWADFYSRNHRHHS